MKRSMSLKRSISVSNSSFSGSLTTADGHDEDSRAVWDGMNSNNYFPGFAASGTGDNTSSQIVGPLVKAKANVSQRGIAAFSRAFAYTRKVDNIEEPHDEIQEEETKHPKFERISSFPPAAIKKRRAVLLRSATMNSLPKAPLLKTLRLESGMERNVE